MCDPHRHTLSGDKHVKPEVTESASRFCRWLLGDMTQAIARSPISKEFVSKHMQAPGSLRRYLRMQEDFEASGPSFRQ